MTAPCSVSTTLAPQTVTPNSWSSDPSPLNTAPFTQPVGPTVNVPDSVVSGFGLLFTDEICAYNQTNMYAKEVLGEKYDSWDKVTVEELRAYFGFMILMVSLPALDDHWRRDPLLHYSPKADRISRPSFNFNSNLPRREPGHDRLGPVMEALQERFSTIPTTL